MLLSLVCVLIVDSVHEQCVGVFCVVHSLGKHLTNGLTVDVMGSTRRALQQRQGCVSNKVHVIIIMGYINPDVQDFSIQS